ncbi:MAG: 23S rRNA (uracil(1939)-C(5))-methyltransferase RlmD, partial [Anaerovoracaceae bacterium]
TGTLEFCKNYSKYHKRSHKGLLRNLIVRGGVHTKEILVNLVTTSEPGFDEAGFAQMILNLPLEHTVVGVLRTINDDIADAVKCDQLKILNGRDYYREKIMGLEFHVSAFSFFQTNIEAVERLYQEALALIDDYDKKTVFDLFCGTGTITQTLALSAKKVVGVELVEEAVASAKKNAQLNGLEHCEFIAGDVFEVLGTLEDKPDVIVVDPPRMGIQNKALDRIVQYNVKQIVYISCNPKTLAENLFYLDYYNYKLKYIKPFDNFPNTKHTECIALLELVEGE